ncbi:MAG: tRNA (adenosine(37)-N6)-threonylcarbamoyltransferase complex transferase subunit TsaD [bacterium]|nr:tRNA (adenosine(37)-N6)-threonylcarbamoyltransferase complex transferase subunit TsaD [bacterium]
MIILGIETSCDDTGITIIEGEKKEEGIAFHILAHRVSSQASLHAPYGGVYPSLAKREHEKNLPLVLSGVMEDARLSLKDINAISVTVGPGLSPCLWSGINFASALARDWSCPLVPTNHIEGHLLISLLTQTNENFQFPIFNFQKNHKSQTNHKSLITNHQSPITDHKFQVPNTQKQVFPAIVLIVSGGHTQIIHMPAFGLYNIIGETRDDAAGECFDKTARILGLPYPGGPAIAANAAQNQKSKIKNQNDKSKFQIKLPRPMEHTKDYDFSFSGLKTAVLYDYKARAQAERESEEYVQEMSYKIQEAIADILVKKTLAAAEEYNASSVVLGGGVAANKYLNDRFSMALPHTPLLVSLPSLSGDNGLISALPGLVHILEHGTPASNSPLEAVPNLRLE